MQRIDINVPLIKEYQSINKSFQISIDRLNTQHISELQSRIENIYVYSK